MEDMLLGFVFGLSDLLFFLIGIEFGKKFFKK